MIQGLFPNGALDPDGKKISIQSLLFGHRLKPQQTRYEYLVEFLQVTLAKKRIQNSENKVTSDMFPISEELNNHVLEYMPISNMGLKRFIFFENSRLETKAPIDRDAYLKCRDILNKSIKIEGADITEKESLFILQNILYGFSIENIGRSWFNKSLLPICPEVIFPESLARKEKREGVSLDEPDIDNSFDFNSYTYMARGGEIYYLHMLHAINNGGEERKKVFENQISKMLNSIPELSVISNFIQDRWSESIDYEEFDVNEYVVKKRLGAIPLEYSNRDNMSLNEMICFLNNRIQPMEKMNLMSYGIVLQIFRLMTSTAAKGSLNPGSAWVLDVSNSQRKEYSEIRKLAAHCYNKNEESITKYIDIGIEHYYSKNDIEDKDKRRKDADKDTNKLIRKLGKNMGIIIPITGPGMRMTLSEDVIKFLVMALVPANSKVTYDFFLDLLYEHFEMVISSEHYERAMKEGKVVLQSNVAFLNANKEDFAQKLKDCGFLHDLSDATSIVENPYEGEEDIK